MRIDPKRERRREHRVVVSASAVLFLEGVELGEFAVDNLSVWGALFTGDIGAAPDDRLTALLTISGLPAIEVDARVVRVRRSQGCVKMAVELEHWSSFSEDALREALLGARSKSEMPPVAPHLPEPWEMDDPDLIEVVPPPP